MPASAGGESKMIKSCLGLAVAAVLLAGTAGAEEIHGEATFAWLAVGQSYTLGDGRPYFVGAFSGINVFKDDGGGPLANSAIQCPGYNDIGVDAAGYCIVTAGDGDKVFIKWTCVAAEPAAGDLAACEGRADITGGTGKFDGATGGNNFTAHVRVVNPDGTTAGYSDLRDYVVTY
jgi:hypothetical protein